MPAAYNTTLTPVQISLQGHVLGGGETRDVDPTDPFAAAAIADGRLVIQAEPPIQAETAKPNKGA